MDWDLLFRGTPWGMKVLSVKSGLRGAFLVSFVDCSRLH